MVDDRRGLPSASSGDRLYNCPGSRALEALAPEDTPSGEAQEGTAIAEALEKETDEGLDESGKTIFQRLSEMEKQAIDEWANEKAIAPSKLIIIREAGDRGRFWIRDRSDLHLLSSAKPDVVAHDSHQAIVLNHKTGYLDVPKARGNIQTRIEVLAVWHDIEGIVAVRGAIAQFRFRGKFSATDYDLALLKRAEQEHVFALWRSSEEDAPRVPGYWCKYCRAKAFCPQAASLSLLPVVAMPKAEIAKKDIPAAVATLSLEQLGFLRHKSAMIENILDAVAKRLKTFSAEELATVGLKLEPSKGIRTLPDVQALWTALHAENVSEVEFRSVLRATYGAAQELIITKLQASDPSLTEKEAKERADKILAPAVKMAAREPSLKSL